MGEVIVAFLIMFAVVVVGVAIISVPIMIANARGISGGEKVAIIILSFFGITWFVALILSLVWHGDCLSGDNLDKLEKLSKLYKDKVITKSEYERMKSKLMRE